jgi:hypothetical protein
LSTHCHLTFGAKVAKRKTLCLPRGRDVAAATPLINKTRQTYL